MLCALAALLGTTRSTLGVRASPAVAFTLVRHQIRSGWGVATKGNLTGFESAAQAFQHTYGAHKAGNMGTWNSVVHS